MIFLGARVNRFDGARRYRKRSSGKKFGGLIEDQGDDLDHGGKHFSWHCTSTIVRSIPFDGFLGSQNYSPYALRFWLACDPIWCRGVDIKHFNGRVLENDDQTMRIKVAASDRLYI